MKVLDLQCAVQHQFEGWFGSEADFQDQLQRRLVECPLCGDTQVSKRVSAPRLNLRTARQADEITDRSAQPVDHTALRKAQAAWLRWSRQVAAQAEDVGDRFAAEARSIHAGESPDRCIRGRTTLAQAVALLEEGVPVLPLPVAAVPGDALQ